VQLAVEERGALLDIFPSIHTALSVLCALHAFRYRNEAPMRWVWLLTLFAVANIVIATVFLRWHYGVDLIAGAALAASAQAVAIRMWPHEGARAQGPSKLQEVWEPFFPIEMEKHDRAWAVGITCILVSVLVLFAVAEGPH
jgi:hypothetical protein